MRKCLNSCFFGCTLVLACAWPNAGQAADSPQALQFFETKIRPVLVNNCYECHSDKAVKIQGGLLLDSRDGLRRGGFTGPAIVPGKPAESILLQALRHEKLKMPPKKRLSDDVLRDFEIWVTMGAPDNRAGTATSYKRLSAEEAKSFWSFVPVKKFDIPKVGNDHWPKSEVDRFVLAKLEAKGLRPVGDADRATLIRRLSFDLIGLPPKPDEIAAFESDNDPAAIEKVVDRLLGSPHFGERWGRYWLDLARYGESNGKDDNLGFPEAWRYRNYVIKSLNQDKPYDRFIREQISGDLLPAASPAMKDELLIATGFLALTSKPRAQRNPDYRFDLLADQIDVTTRAVLALTVICARCHDHKFDPISTKEYYALAGIFNSSAMLYGRRYKGGGAYGDGGFHDLSNGDKAMGVEDVEPSDCSVCIGGDSQIFGEKVPRAGFLKVASLGNYPPPIQVGSGRLELAEWLTARQNPLTARVAVNRIWLHLFGRAIVTSPDDFGFLGSQPSHPELLDYLAIRFMDSGWSVKQMIRYLCLSRTYQLACGHDETAYAADPDNIYRWRMGQRRLDAEAFRDAVMFVSGELDLSMLNGANIVEGMDRNKPTSTYTATKHRTIYLGIVRGSALDESLSLFDVANPGLIVAQREETIVPGQALYLMNGSFMTRHGKALADLMLGDKNLDDGERIELIYRKLFARVPTSAEKDRCLQHVGAMIQENQMKPSWAWASLCQALMASAEFRYLR